MATNRVPVPDVIASLRALAAREPATAAERDEWIADCVALTVAIDLDPDLPKIVPESVRHFLLDADSQFKDSAHAAARVSAFASALAVWERALTSDQLLDR